MSGLLLTKAERDRFAEWLEREAQSDKALSRQIQGFPTGKTINDELAKRYNVHAAACLIVAQRLRETIDEKI